MSSLLILIILIYIIPFSISLFYNINTWIVGIYLILILLNVYNILKKSLKKSKLMYPYYISSYGIFNICCLYFIINYYSKDMPEYFNNGKLIYNAIYSDAIKGILLSVIAAVIFGWYSDYKKYCNNYFVFLEIEYSIRKLWARSYYYEYGKFENYMNIKKKDIKSIIEDIKYKEVKIMDELQFKELKGIAYEIEHYPPTINTLLNQNLYYLIRGIKNIEYKDYKENKIKITLEKLSSIIEILNLFKKIKKSPLEEIIKN